MAYQIRNISPLDLKASTAIGVSIPFNGPGVFNFTYTTSDQLKSNIINFFLTNKGERIMNPDFGGNLRQELFEQITNGTLNDIRLSIIQSLQTVFPNIVVNEVNVLGDEDKHNISVSIKYSIPNTNIKDELNLNFANG